MIQKMQISELKLASWNVRGIHNKKSAIRRFQNQVDILFLNETWMRADTAHNQDWIAENETAPLKSNGGAKGRVALIINPLIPYIKKGSYSDEYTQWIAIQITDITIAGIYLSPTAEPEYINRILSKLKKMGNKIIIIGDLNSRHKAWDTRNNRRVTKLKEEAIRRGWDIHTTDEPTCYNWNGSSTIDIILTQNMEIGNVRILHHPEESKSDHLTIITKIAVELVEVKKNEFIPISQRQHEECVEEAKDALPQQLDNLERKSMKSALYDN